MRQPLLVLAAATLAACQSTPQPTPAAAQALGWSEASHGKGATPDYGVVFPQDHVAEFKITVAPADWAKMLDDMTKNYGARGTGMGMGGPVGLDYNVLPMLFRLNGIARKDQPEYFECLRRCVARGCK